MPRGVVRSCGLPRRDMSCEFAGLTPGARPVVPRSDGAGGLTPGVGEPPGLVPGVAGDAGEAAVPPVLVPPVLPPPALPPELCARAMPPVSAKAANAAQMRFMFI